jgi:murein DD-endopeptidase MepM/ murein hydrolase activator NlpD
MDYDFKPRRQPKATPPASRRRLLMPLTAMRRGAAAVSSLLRRRPGTDPGPAGDPSPSPGRRRLLPAAAAALLLAAAGAAAWWAASPGEDVVVAPALEPAELRKVIEGTVRSGDTLTALLGEYFDDRQFHALVTQSSKVFPLTSLCSGQPYKLCVNAGEFESFEYDIDRDQQLIIRREGEGFDVSRIPIAYTVKTGVVRGSIVSSLFEAVGAAGESDALAVMLADIFAYDIDFIRDLRTGDTFELLVEKRFREGKPAGYGRIQAASFSNQGTTYTAFHYQDGKNPPGYYDADGKALRKAFLKAPLAFSRISSGFTMKRFHPIAKTWRAHPAIDYAAPTGTPIMAIGDGTVVRIGRSAGNGNFVRLRHNGGIESMYLHMSRFAKGMRQGKRVQQGQTIGYVGSTGLATGPHLCFRMFQGGSPINPARLKTASAAPIPRDRLPAFRAAIEPLQARLQGRDTALASAAPGAPPKP